MIPEHLTQIAKLSDDELAKHANVGRTMCRCGDCFCCGCEAERVRRGERGLKALTTAEIKDALKQNCFNVYMRTSPEGLTTYRVIGARIKEGRAQVKTMCRRATYGYLWWSVTPVMQIYTA